MWVGISTCNVGNIQTGEHADTDDADDADAASRMSGMHKCCGHRYSTYKPAQTNMPVRRTFCNAVVRRRQSNGSGFGLSAFVLSEWGDLNTSATMKKSTTTFVACRTIWTLLPLVQWPGPNLSQKWYTGVLGMLSARNTMFHFLCQNTPLKDYG